MYLYVGANSANGPSPYALPEKMLITALRWSSVACFEMYS
jgi:hypothetical protein